VHKISNNNVSNNTAYNNTYPSLEISATAEGVEERKWVPWEDRIIPPFQSKGMPVTHPHESPPQPVKHPAEDEVELYEETEDVPGEMSADDLLDNLDDLALAAELNEAPE
jgi:hypothetical protein